ncbi:MAG: BPSL0067 family protein [Burkholderiaceae bacterium]
MPYVDPEVDALEGHDLVGSRQCVTLIQAYTRAPRTADWRRGARVRGNLMLAKGTAIATFEDGVYKSRPHGNHAAFYLRQDQGGIWVMDQWRHVRKLKVASRYLRCRGTNVEGAWADTGDNGDAFSVIE